MPSLGGVPGTSQGTAQNTLRGLCLSAGLGTPWAPPGGGVWGERRLGVSAAPTTWSQIAEDDEYEIYHVINLMTSKFMDSNFHRGDVNHMLVFTALNFTMFSISHLQFISS
ncbi:hypothetical protein AMECASPLE_039007 [Ameca splendens]|uniref:Uncharacterized protein n=1 Tax=Ameca splendens TaxID=208324 RepID=A0ABV0Y8R0_9TELE